MPSSQTYPCPSTVETFGAINRTNQPFRVQIYVTEGKNPLEILNSTHFDGCRFSDTADGWRAKRNLLRLKTLISSTDGFECRQ